MSTIAIYGANGYAGDAIRSEALRRGHRVLAYSRSGSAREGSPGVDVSVGNVHDEESLRAVAEDADVIIMAIPARALNGKKLVEAVPSILDVAAGAGTRVGFVGGSGSLHVADGGPLLMESAGFPGGALPEAMSHAEVLATLRRSTVGSWFYVSPAAKFGAHAPIEPAGSYLVGDDVMLRDSRGESALSDVDLATAVLDEIENPSHENVRFSVVGAY